MSESWNVQEYIEFCRRQQAVEDRRCRDEVLVEMERERDRRIQMLGIKYWACRAYKVGLISKCVELQHDLDEQEELVREIEAAIKARKGG